MVAAGACRLRAGAPAKRQLGLYWASLPVLPRARVEDTAPRGEPLVHFGIGFRPQVSCAGLRWSFGLQGDGRRRLVRAGEVGTPDPDHGEVDRQGEQGDSGGDQEPAGEPGGEGVAVDRCR
jgi:hypothetical protein